MITFLYALFLSGSANAFRHTWILQGVPGAGKRTVISELPNFIESQERNEYHPFVEAFKDWEETEVTRFYQALIKKTELEGSAQKEWVFRKSLDILSDLLHQESRVKFCYGPAFLTVQKYSLEWFEHAILKRIRSKLDIQDMKRIQRLLDIGFTEGRRYHAGKKRIFLDCEPREGFQRWIKGSAGASELTFNDYLCLWADCSKLKDESLYVIDTSGLSIEETLRKVRLCMEEVADGMDIGAWP